MKDADKTRLVHTARTHIFGPTSSVNPPIVRASTVLYEDTATMRDVRRRNDAGEQLFRYGARGTPTTFAFENALSEIEGGTRTMLFPTGLAAVAHPFLSLLKPGDHLLLAETVYGPARAIARQYLAPRGIECEFYPAGANGPAEVATRLRDTTRMVYLDNPGSIVLDVQDLPAIAEVARGKGRDCVIAVDNTWGAPGLYKPLLLGADVSIVAVTKYIAGHSDLLMGSVTAGPRVADQLWQDAGLLGQTVSADDAYAALRGLRTAAARLAMHEANGRAVMAWLVKHPKVRRVIYPGLESDPGYALWKRDFSGGNGLFSFEFTADVTKAQADRFVDALELFGIGASWGGYESLVLVYDRIPGWSGNELVRVHAGLESPSDIIADLERGFAAL